MSLPLKDHEETLRHWWLMGMRWDDAIVWGQIADWCHGARQALVCLPGGVVRDAMIDYCIAGELAYGRVKVALDEAEPATTPPGVRAAVRLANRQAVTSRDLAVSQEVAS